MIANKPTEELNIIIHNTKFKRRPQVSKKENKNRTNRTIA